MLKENPSHFFRFSFWATLFFNFMNEFPGLMSMSLSVDIDKKPKKLVLGFSFYIKIANYEAFL